MWEPIADRFPDALAQRHDGAMYDVARVRPARRRHRRARCSPPASPSRTRSPSTSTTVPSTSRVVFAAFKAGLAVVNTNYRYTDDELVYLWDNADVVAVVFHGTFAEQCDGGPRPAAARSRRGSGSTTASGPCPTGRSPYEDAAAAPATGARRRAVGSLGRPPAAALHRRHHRHAEGRDVAPGRPVRRPRLQPAGKRLPPGQDLDAARRRGSTKPGPRNLPGGTADARHRLVQRDDAT